VYKAMKVLAIVVLIVTIAGAGAVLYGIETLSPVVEQVHVAATPAAQAQDVFEDLLSQANRQTFTGRVFAQPGALDAENCTFVTYTVRLSNRGFFPAEWISLDIAPVQGDVLQMDNVQANVLPRGSRGDIAATILHAGDNAAAARTYTIHAYVLGRKITLEGTAQ